MRKDKLNQLILFDNIYNYGVEGQAYASLWRTLKIRVVERIAGLVFNHDNDV